MDAAIFFEYLRYQVHVENYIFLSAAALFSYDYILTLHLEVKLIWLSPWTSTKVLFLIVRYFGLVAAVLYPVGKLIVDINVETCKVMYPAAIWIVTLKVIVSEIIQCIRTWAVWRRNKAVGSGLAILMIILFVSQCILVNRFVRSIEFAPPPFAEFNGCFVTKTRPDLWLCYVLITVAEFVIFALMVISAFKSYRKGFTGELSRVIHMDGILFYLYLVSLTTAYFATIFVVPADIINLLTPLQDSLYTVLTTRMVFNIRQVNVRGLQTESPPIGHDESLVFAVPVRSVSDELYRDRVSCSQP